MPTSATQSLLFKPYGPYLDVDILKPPGDVNIKFKRYALPLKELVLCRNGEPLGLDNIEDVSFRDEGLITFRGILQLSSIKWLSETGERWLRLAIVHRGGHRSTLEQLIAEDQLKIKIQCTLFGSPHYLTDCKATDFVHASRRLMLESVGVNAREKCWVYLIETMHIHTYQNSRVYMSRYRALHAIKLVVRQDAERTLRQDRTADWLVERYLRLVRRWNAAQHAENPIFHARVIHRSEIYHLFARHGKWLRTVIKNQKLLNLIAWDKFCKEAIQRHEAWKNGMDDSDLDETFGALPERVSPTDSDEDIEMEEDDVKSEGSDGNESEGEYYRTADIDVRYSPLLGSPAFSDDEDNAAVEKSKARIDPDFYDPEELSPEIFNRPSIPPDFNWRCPVPNCKNSIHLLSPTEETLKDLNQGDKEYIMSKQWKMSDQKLLELFEDMVERHYFRHFMDKDIKVVAYGTNEKRRGHKVMKEREVTQPGELKEGDQMRLEWKNPGLHALLRSHKSKT